MTPHAAHRPEWSPVELPRAGDERNAAGSVSGACRLRFSSTKTNTGPHASAGLCEANNPMGDGTEMFTADGRRMRRMRRARRRYRWSGGQLAPVRRAVLRRAVTA